MFLEENLSQHCQLPKLWMHGELWGWGNLLHIFSVQLEGKQQMIALKDLDNVETQGGASDGTCAAGFGTCCTFLAPCDSETTENGTYFSRWSSVIRVSSFLFHFLIWHTRQSSLFWMIQFVKELSALVCDKKLPGITWYNECLNVMLVLISKI